MLWPIAVPPIDLNDLSEQINPVARMTLIKRLILDSGPELSMQALRDWINDPLRDDDSTTTKDDAQPVSPGADSPSKTEQPTTTQPSEGGGLAGSSCSKLSVTVTLTVMEHVALIRALREKEYNARLVLAQNGGSPKDHADVDMLEHRIGVLSMISPNKEIAG